MGPSRGLVGEVGLEPTKAKPADLQSAPFAARDIPPVQERALWSARRALSTANASSPERANDAATCSTALPLRRFLCQTSVMKDWKKEPARGARFTRPRFDRAGDAQRERRREGPYTHLLYGFHSVREALDNPRRRLLRLLVTENALARLKESGPLPIEPQIVRPDAIGRLLTADAVHQGVLLEAEPPEAPALSALPDDALVLALDQITDPHNVGAILRSAAAFGVAAAIVTQRHAPEVTGVLAKAASGALEHVPLIAVRNLVAALNELADRGFQRIGLDSDAPQTIDSVALRRPAVIVLGAEGKGLRQSTRAACEIMARLELPGAIRSLNVSNAAAITLYALTRRADPRGQSTTKG